MDENQVMEKINLAINDGQTQQKGLHVSALVYACLRRGYYTQKYGEGFFNFKTLMTFWIGRLIHDTPILKEHELSMNWEGIIGTCDEYEDGTLLEKKTCTQIPKFANDHHITQAEYYSAMLDKIGKPVKSAFIVYFDINEKNIKVFPIRLRPLPVIEKEMLQRRTALQEAMAGDKAPERKTGWLCNYCNFASICFRRDNGDKEYTSIGETDLV